MCNETVFGRIRMRKISKSDIISGLSAKVSMFKVSKPGIRYQEPSNVVAQPGYLLR